MFALTPVLLLQLGQGIAIETDSPDAHCPDLHQTQAAVEARLGAVQGTGWRARYTIVHARAEVPRDFLLLELLSPEGELRLRRELPLGESCAAARDAIALVLDQYFRALVAHEEPVPAETAPPPRPSPPPDDPPRGPAADPAARPEKPSVRILLELAAVSFPASLSPGIRLEGAWPPWHLGVELAAPLGDRVEALSLGGEARARTFELFGHFGWGPELGVARPFVGPTLFLLLERGATTHPLASTTKYRLLAGAGFEIGLSVRLHDRWQAVGFASGGRTFVETATFVVGGREVLDGIAWLGRAGFGLAYSF